MPLFDLHPERCEKVIEAQPMTPSCAKLRQIACFNTEKKEVHLYTSSTPTKLPPPKITSVTKLVQKLLQFKANSSTICRLPSGYLEMGPIGHH